MKKTIKQLSILFSILLMAVFTSCDSDDDATSDDDGGSTTETELAGSISSDMTLDSSQTYTLNGILSVENGATLTIPAGTEIKTGTGTDIYIAVQKGADIMINGTASEPVKMSPADATGNWGGLLLLGEGVTTEGVDAVAEVGGLIYGGTDNADNSGSINYLIIEGSGAQINSESQYNGLTLYAVGSGTSLNNIAIINGADDGIEFFGGAAEVSNVYVQDLEDDAIDWTEGWSGTLTNTYVYHSTENFSTAIEADGSNNNPTITNFTAISETGGVALQFKKQSGATITGLSLTGYETVIDMPDNGPLANIQIEGEDASTEMSYGGATTVNLEDFAWVNAALAATEELPSSVTSDLTLNADTNYYLDGIMSVDNGATLTIPAGTNIVTNTGTDVYIAVQAGSDIMIEGTADNPVKMGPNGTGTWGGLIILGNGETTEGVDAVAEVGGLIYGGSDNSDNSGSIEYLIIRQSGAQINSESQYNGLTLYAVGSGTTINNIALIDGADDGIEFFGGAAVVTNVYVENLQDDAIDWTEGWSGSLTNTYVKHTSANFSTAIEADGTNNNPTISNFTAVSTEGGLALQFKKQSGATITNLTVTGYDTLLDTPDSAPVSGILVDGASIDAAGTYNGSTVVESDFDWVN
ncbi:hypothetical protein SAMN04488096_10915 [Mesonia phycicola]|uniref:Right handed beta helix region n=1 Tax=Mesonia phycicola TaxID=579105 RepID=A0A1M6GY91_9FLAO|nr:hypothetical protein [Mesonia phycicola]SHJ14876.1 hypothetical protein SAMN04488096_10915 [Mesonia phycicola]